MGVERGVEFLPALECSLGAAGNTQYLSDRHRNSFALSKRVLCCCDFISLAFSLMRMEGYYCQSIRVTGRYIITSCFSPLNFLNA